jgi:hypothetical protein
MPGNKREFKDRIQCSKFEITLTQTETELKIKKLKAATF